MDPVHAESTGLVDLETVPSVEEQPTLIDLQTEIGLLRPKKLVKQFFRLPIPDLRQVATFCRETSLWCEQQIVLQPTNQIRPKDVNALFDAFYGKMKGFFSSIHQILLLTEKGIKTVADEIYWGVQTLVSHISAADITVVFDVTAAIVTFVLSMNFPVLTPFIPLLLGIEAVLGHITVNDFHTVFTWLLSIERELAKFVKKLHPFSCFS
jgi:hypothetical protein